MIDHFVREKDRERLAKPGVIPPVDVREPLKVSEDDDGDDERARCLTICRICSAMAFAVDCCRSAESKLASTLRYSSRNVRRPQDDEARASTIRSGVPMKSRGTSVDFHGSRNNVSTELRRPSFVGHVKKTFGEGQCLLDHVERLIQSSVEFRSNPYVYLSATVTRSASIRELRSRTVVLDAVLVST